MIRAGQCHFRSRTQTARYSNPPPPPPLLFYSSRARHAAMGNNRRTRRGAERSEVNEKTKRKTTHKTRKSSNSRDTPSSSSDECESLSSALAGGVATPLRRLDSTSRMRCSAKSVNALRTSVQQNIRSSIHVCSECSTRKASFIVSTRWLSFGAWKENGRKFQRSRQRTELCYRCLGWSVEADMAELLLDGGSVCERGTEFLCVFCD